MASPEPVATSNLPIINIYGFFGGQFGLGESARLYAAALRSAGIPVATVDIDLGLPHARQPLPASPAPNPAASAVDIVVVNPDHLADALPTVNATGPGRRFRVGCWFWELGRLPKSWVDAIADVDAIMVSSRFIGGAIAPFTDKPVFCVPLPLAERRDSGLGRTAFGLSESAYIFMVSFDFHSSIHRKNPRDAIASFMQAFPHGDEDVQLLVKSTNGEHYQQQLASLIELARHDSRIIIRNHAIDAAHMCALQRCCDAYVSLHRAEGFGLGLAECMAMGKPVIATAWSGNTDFMDVTNSCPVGAVLVPISPDEYAYSESGLAWAQPDVAQAAGWMRKLVDDRCFGEAIGRAAASDIRKRHAPECVASALLTQLGTARAVASIGLPQAPNGRRAK